ncbi:MAG: hypothetical protein HYT14_02255 [Candidatus Liptonbacteria bacterium]|nr:hypothetical protein [Candidatus Liptonbacteria bacterium]
MHRAWNKGLTKETHSSVLKISETMRARKIDNFKIWRQHMKNKGRVKSNYPPLKKSGDLAELIGVVLGDGYIGKFPRAEVLRIVSNGNNSGFIHRYGRLVGKVFMKRPYIAKRKKANAVDITIYEKNISRRLSIPAGARYGQKISVPRWISSNRDFAVRYLRGLYEAEGSYNIHEPTSTYKLIFTNRNASLLSNVYNLLSKLGFHPHTSKDKVQLSRKQEVEKARNLLQFRIY